MALRALACLLLMIAGAIAANPPACPALKVSEKARLVTYVQKKYALGEKTALQVSEASSECGNSMRKLVFRSAGPKGKFSLELYASPDLRFLTRQVLDTTIDPVVQERKDRDALQASLRAGQFASTGDPKSPVLVTIFSDFQCPYCSRLAEMLRTQVLPQSRNVRFAFRHYPLPQHGWARTAATVAECVRQQNNDQFWRLHDYIFEHQREFEKDTVKNVLVGQATSGNKVEKRRLLACVASPATDAMIEADVKLGSKSGVSGTPAVFINGTRVKSVGSPEQLLTLIRETAIDTRAAK